ncbi:MAG: hypothetical protein AAFR02_11025 [Pseudomonadota bacterium]
MKTASQIQAPQPFVATETTREPFVNELTSGNLESPVAKPRPHILRRREERWARRFDR